MAHYFKSEDVKVYPCQFRGNGIDVKSSLMTEEGLVNGSSLGSLASSYIVSYDDVGGTLKCVICGYYFEIHNLSNYSNWNHLKIELGTINVGGEETIILSSLDKDADNVLDKTIGGESYFIGLSYESTGQLKVFDENGEIAKESILPKFTDTGAISQEDNDNAIGAWSAKLGHNTTTGSYAIAAGNGSSAMGEASAAFNSSTTNAKKAFAANSGAATGENSFSANVSTASGDSSFTANKGEATGNSSAAFNLAEAKNDNEFACGKFNESTADTTIFTVGNGTEGDRKNAFEIDKDDSAKFAGDVTISGEACINDKLVANEEATFNKDANFFANVSIAETLTAKNLDIDEKITAGELDIAGGAKIDSDGGIKANKIEADSGNVDDITGKTISIKPSATGQKQLAVSAEMMSLAWSNQHRIDINGSETTITGKTKINGSAEITGGIKAANARISGNIEVTGEANLQNVSIGNNKAIYFLDNTSQAKATVEYSSSDKTINLNAAGVKIPTTASNWNGNLKATCALKTTDKDGGIYVHYDTNEGYKKQAYSGYCEGYAMKIGQNGENGIYQIWGCEAWTPKEDRSCTLTFVDGMQVKLVTVTSNGQHWDLENEDKSRFPHLVAEYKYTTDPSGTKIGRYHNQVRVYNTQIHDSTGLNPSVWTFDFMAIVEWPNH